MPKLLIDGITSTDSVKRTFDLTGKDFAGSSLPALKASGLGAGDTVRIWEYIDAAWQNTGVTLSNAAGETSKTIGSVGNYAVDAVMGTSGPVSCDLNSSNQ